jgi:probable rRNA maturation factor
MKNNIKNKHHITFENVTKAPNLPSLYQFRRWVNLALTQQQQPAVVHIRIVNKAEIARLNQLYRYKTGPTNILSFPFETHGEISSPVLGDLVICAPLMAKEATEQNKSLIAHWAHITVHGTLHLLGYDHIKTKDAVIMEKLEIVLLQKLGYPNPYE